MELTDFIGEHYLSGLDQVIEKAKEEWDEDGNAFLFILDGITYKAVEDPSDGYRSYLRSIEISDEKVSYTFPPQKVIGRMKENEEYSNNNVIQFIDPITEKVVLEFGDDNFDDYYPSCVLNWNPENLSINQTNNQ